MMIMGIAACDRSPQSLREDVARTEAVPSDRIDIPQSVRRNLGIEFARVESRTVDTVLRIPGRFELLPDGRRDHHAPVQARIEILVSELDTVGPGTPLYRLTGSGWLDLEERLAQTRSRLESTTTLREAHLREQQALSERIDVWNERLDQQERLRKDGGGNATALAKARSTLNTTRLELAQGLEEDARLRASEEVIRSEMTVLLERRDQILGVTGCPDDDGPGLLVCSTVEGVVERIHATSGTHLAEGDPTVSVIRPDRIRVRARMLQSDLAMVRDGLPARITAPNAHLEFDLPWMPATIRLSPVADADGRTIDLLAAPGRLEPWARPGVGVSLGIILDGGRIELAVPERAVVDDGAVPVLFRRDPDDPDRVIRIDADLGGSDGRWIEILSGLIEGDEIVVSGQDQLLLAEDTDRPATGHFHSDGTFHAEDH
jgi:multidrug efflux pump subunit AcrA (membrane-fusion protein)